jgi:hypothetical protein
MSVLFGYKSKMIREGLYEVFEPAPDARYILSKVFKRAFLRVQNAKLVSHHKGHGMSGSSHLLAPASSQKRRQAQASS